MRTIIIASSFLLLVLVGVVGAQQMISGDVNKFLKDGYTIQSTHVLSSGFVYHLIKGKDFITCVSGVNSGNVATVCFKP